MTANGFLGILISIVSVFFIWKHLGPVVRFLWPQRVVHRRLEGVSKPKKRIVDDLESNGFEYLGTRLESIFFLWNHSSSVFVRESRITADIAHHSGLRGSYFATFWDDGACAMTRLGSPRSVKNENYVSQGVSSRTKIPELLAGHYKAEAALGRVDEPVKIDSLDERIRLARKWYAENARNELAGSGLIGGLLAASFIAFWIYSFVLLFS